MFAVRYTAGRIFRVTTVAEHLYREAVAAKALRLGRSAGKAVAVGYLDRARIVVEKSHHHVLRRESVIRMLIRREIACISFHSTTASNIPVSTRPPRLICTKMRNSPGCGKP